MTNNSITAEKIQATVNWGPATRNGSKLVRTAIPNASFWTLWRGGEANKQAIRDLGVRVRPGANNEWTLTWTTEAQAMTRREFLMPAAKPGCSWSGEQKSVFTWFANGCLPDGRTAKNLVVRARAGTGKTTTIKEAFSVAPEETALYCVFNKKNQREAKNAIFDPRVDIMTLHSLGLKFIQAVWPGIRPDDTVERDRVTKVVGKDTAREIKSQVYKLVGFAKNTLISPTMKDLIELAEERDIQCEKFEAQENGGWDRVKLAHHAMLVLEASRERDPEGRISFNDMVWLPVRQGWVRAVYNLVVVDECQDMNLPQLMMAIAACRADGRICVVGDDRQAIYHFRGAASDGMDMMRVKLAAAELGLTITYRCPKKVVALAAAIVPDYRAADSAPEGIVEQAVIDNCMATIKIGDAIISRSNAPLMPLCLELLRKGTPARIEGRDVGKALLDIVEDLNARSVPQFITKVETWRERQIHRFENTEKLEEKAAQINDQADTLIAIAEGASSVGEIENRLRTLFQNSDDKGVMPAVVLTTVHKAKGLEWEKVVMLRDTFNRKRPASAPPLSPEAEAARAREEANIYYVALTRAKAHLVMATERR